MPIRVRCLECNQYYICNKGNTKIFGPIIDSTCPVCGKTTSKNYSAFLDEQTSHIMAGKYVLHFKKTRAMISLAQAISGIISNEESFKKKKK